MGVLCCQLRVIELLSGGLRDIAVDGGVSGSLLCAVGLHDLAGYFLLASENRRRCSVLAINDRKLTALHRRDYDGSELRPIEVLGDLIDVGCAPPTDFTLMRVTSTTSFAVSIHSRNGAGPGENSDAGELNRCAHERYTADLLAPLWSRWLLLLGLHLMIFGVFLPGGLTDIPGDLRRLSGLRSKKGAASAARMLSNSP